MNQIPDRPQKIFVSGRALAYSEEEILGFEEKEIFGVLLGQDVLVPVAERAEIVWKLDPRKISVSDGWIIIEIKDSYDTSTEEYIPILSVWDEVKKA
ncbi:MAG: hypothetical protein GXP63_02310 [DPANN group archaeon]|nr:hypothetical protein [DPANN group archaeon]